MVALQQPEKSHRDKLAAIIRNRLELDEEWFPVTDRPRFFDRIKTKDWHEFEAAFRRVLELGCRGDVLLTCLARFDTYNSEEIVLSQAPRHHGEEWPRPKTKWQPFGKPPGKDERDSIRRKLDAAFGRIKRYESLLSELGQLEAPPRIFAAERLSVDDAIVPAPILSADEAIAYLPKLLKWCERLLSDDSFGNFRTVESVRRLVPCVYVELITSGVDSTPDRKRRQPFVRVTDLLHEMGENANSDQADFLREAMRRFQRDYEGVYRQLKTKISALHRSATTSPDGWQRLFADERERRSRPKS